MKNQRTIAKLTGYSLLLMAVLAGFIFGYAYPEFFNPVELELTGKKISESLLLYKYMLFACVLIILLDISISWNINSYFKKDSERYSSIAFALRMIYTLFFSIGVYFLMKNVFETENSISVENYKKFEILWSTGLFIFGFHLITLGYLMELHKTIPRILFIITFFAGCSYLVVHFLKLSFPYNTEFILNLENILALPMALGELGLAVWLILKGGKVYNSEITKS